MEPESYFFLQKGVPTSEIIHLEVNREHWVPVVIGELRNDTLHDGKSSSAVVHYAQFVAS